MSCCNKQPAINTNRAFVPSARPIAVKIINHGLNPHFTSQVVIKPANDRDQHRV